MKTSATSKECMRFWLPSFTFCLTNPSLNLNCITSFCIPPPLPFFSFLFSFPFFSFFLHPSLLFPPLPFLSYSISHFSTSSFLYSLCISPSFLPFCISFQFPTFPTPHTPPPLPFPPPPPPPPPLLSFFFPP